MCKAITSLEDDILQDCYVVTKSETVELYCIVLSQVVYDEKKVFVLVLNEIFMPRDVPNGLNKKLIEF